MESSSAMWDKLSQRDPSKAAPASSPNRLHTSPKKSSCTELLLKSKRTTAVIRFWVTREEKEQKYYCLKKHERRHPSSRCFTPLSNSSGPAGPPHMIYSNSIECSG